MITEVDNASELVIVSNRLPVQRVKHGRMFRWEASPGGLVSALRPILRELSSTWVGWSGSGGDIIAPFEHDGIRNYPVPLSAAEVKSFYEGFSNRGIWPLYHDAMRAPEYRPNWWEIYVDVNRRFAEAAAEVVEPGGMVWVHDYHLQLVPAMLREIQPNVRIGFFLHIPFPPQELFSQLPWRCEILRGILGADLVGFQTLVGAQNFVQLAKRFVNVGGSEDLLVHESRDIQVGAFPISVDFDRFDTLARDENVVKKSIEFRARLGRNAKLMLGLDRLDYTKGIESRLKAFRQLLRSHRMTNCVLVQIAIPSREHVQEYKELRVEVERLVGEINGEFGEIGHTPVQYLHRSVSNEQLVALYLAADVMLVTPLRDGMNLVCKEYCASRVNDDGVLVLSEFTGAAKELKSALLVNPHDLDGLNRAMERALQMPLPEQRVRMRKLRKRVREHNVYDWANSFLKSLAYVRA